MAKQQPEWKISRKVAIVAWRESLPPDLREQHAAAMAEAKVRSAAKRAARVERDRAVVENWLLGLKRSEIAQRAGATPTVVRDICARLGLPLSGDKRRRAPSFSISPESFEQLGALAEATALSPAAVLEKLIDRSFEERGVLARRTLRDLLPTAPTAKTA